MSSVVLPMPETLLDPGSYGSSLQVPRREASAMMYTLTHPHRQVGTSVQLHFDAGDAQVDASEGQPFYEVAVEYDNPCRCLRPLSTPSRGTGPTWTTPADPRGDGSVTATGPIPEWLFTEAGRAHPG
jgi:hypothetical protein